LKKRLGRVPVVRNQGLRPGAAAARLGAGPLKKRLNRGNFEGLKRVASPRIRNRVGVRLQAAPDLTARRPQFVAKKRFVGNSKPMTSNRFGNRKMSGTLVKGKNKNQNQGQQLQAQPQRRPQQGKFKGQLRGNNQRYNNQRNQNQNKNKKNAGGARGGKWQGKRQPKANREQLDQDLDAYMAKTKSHLDADLDTYMADATA
jgi:hypothetical protein